VVSTVNKEVNTVIAIEFKSNTANRK